MEIGVAPYFQMKVHSSSPTSSNPGRWSETICLFRIPEHLRRRWWNLSASEILSNSDARPGFANFQLSFRAFAVFKGIPILHKHDFDILVRPPDSPPSDYDSRLVCLINLNDDPSTVLIGSEKISLEPGDGCWVPEGTDLRPADTMGRADVDILLRVEIRE